MRLSRLRKPKNARKSKRDEQEQEQDAIQKSSH